MAAGVQPGTGSPRLRLVSLALTARRYEGEHMLRTEVRVRFVLPLIGPGALGLTVGNQQ
jgi:hypothetical protein